MKKNLPLSITIHVLLVVVLFISKPGSGKWEGYPTIIPVELVKMEPVSYQLPEVEKVQPHRQEQPKPKKLEGVTLEKKQPEKEEKEQEPEQPPVKDVPKKTQEEGKSTVGDENVRLDVKEFPFSYYLALLKSRIQANWEPPARPPGQQGTIKTVIYFKIERNGRISDIVKESPSGHFIFDQAAVRAVTLADPLPPLPFDFPQSELGVHFEFEQGY